MQYLYKNCTEFEEMIITAVVGKKGVKRSQGQIIIIQSDL